MNAESNRDGEPFPSRRSWAALTTVEVERAIASDPVVVLPLAAVEQHGPHLPLVTDVEIGEGILSAAFDVLSADVPVYTLPMQCVGASEEHTGFRGTLTLPPAVLEDVIVSLGASLARSGVRRLVLFNSHGGNRPVLDTAGLRLRGEAGMLVVKANYFRFPRPEHVVFPESEWSHGLHGGALETAMMSHLRPDLVHSELIDSFPSLGEELADTLETLRPEGAASFSWMAGDLNAAGVTGSAAIGTAESGRHLVEHYGRYLAQVLRDTHHFPIDRLVFEEW